MGGTNAQVVRDRGMIRSFLQDQQLQPGESRWPFGAAAIPGVSLVKRIAQTVKQSWPFGR